jgi:hypothetical protein
MTFTEAISKLFTDTANAGRVSGALAVEVLWLGTWRVLPLEWNTAMRLADLADIPVRMVDGDGSPMRIYPASVQEHA